mgnify:CR=1 FL=1
MDKLTLSMLNILKSLRYYQAVTEPKAWGPVETEALRAFQLSLQPGSVDTTGAAPVGRYNMDNVVFDKKVLRIKDGQYYLEDAATEPAAAETDATAPKAVPKLPPVKQVVVPVTKAASSVAVSEVADTPTVPSGPVISEPLTQQEDQ